MVTKNFMFKKNLQKKNLSIAIAGLTILGSRQKKDVNVTILYMVLLTFFELFKWLNAKIRIKYKWPIGCAHTLWRNNIRGTATHLLTITSVTKNWAKLTCNFLFFSQANYMKLSDTSNELRKYIVLVLTWQILILKNKNT